MTTRILLVAVLLTGTGSVALAQATSGVDTNQNTLPFSISGTPVMTLSAGGLTFNSASSIPLSFGVKS